MAPDAATGAEKVRQARIAGLLGFAILAAGTFSGWVGSSLIVPGDAAATVSNLRASEGLFRLGIVAGLVMYAVFIVYALALYRLLEHVGRRHAVLMVALALVGVPIAMLNQVNQAAVLLLLNGAGGPDGFPADLLQAQVSLFLGLHRQGNLVAVVFWGLWLFPLGLLVYRSGFLPRVLGVLLVIGCFGWLAVVVQRLLLPDFEALSLARYAAHLAELSFILWLLVRGVDPDGWEERLAGRAPG